MKKVFFGGLKNHWKDYILVLICGIFMVTIIFLSNSLSDCLQWIIDGQITGNAEESYSFFDFSITYLLLVFMMILIIFSYIRKRSYDYVLLDVMGIQKRHKYIFIGCEYLGIVVISILGGILFGAILSEIIKIELEKIFPSNLHSKALGVIRTLIEVQEKIKSHPDLKKRYFLKPDEVILLADGTKIVVNNQWGTLFPRFLEAAKKLYQVTNDTESNTPISRLKITFGNGKVIQETQAAETFRQFVMTVGVEQVQSLNIKVCKIPLISNTLHEKYQRAQKPLGNGRFLMTCSNTKTKKRDIERIAKALGIQVTVEIV